MWCPFSWKNQEQETVSKPITFKTWKDLLDLTDLSWTSLEVDKILTKVLNDWKLFESICDIESPLDIKNAPRWSQTNLIETWIYWKLMKEVIQKVIEEVLNELEFEKQVHEKSQNKWIIDDSIILKLSTENDFWKKLQIITIYVLKYFDNKILTEISNIKQEQESWMDNDKHQLLQLIKIISKDYWEKNFLKSEFIKLFIDIWVFNTIGNNALMINSMIEKLWYLDINTLRECINNSQSFFIDISRSNVFLHFIMSKKNSIMKYNKEKNCFELNISIEEAEKLSTETEMKWQAYTSCPMLYWKTSFFWKNSNWILDFQKLTFEIIILIMQRSWMIK